jgi:cellulose synthase/poly-beta-1,6-N-acetylglucosamine synthase-like glycosyltransferase
MIWVFPLIFTIYCLLIIYLSIGFVLENDFKRRKTDKKTSFSIIVPFRNEAENLPKLLSSIKNLNYPSSSFEIIFVDDASSDNSVEIIKEHKKTIANICLIQNERKTNSPKKDAIATAIQSASFDWILTTDADCLLPKNWLTVFNECIVETTPIMVVAPVNYAVKNTFLAQFQLFDFMSLQGATIGGFGHRIPFLCNGANLGYQKEIFKSVNGFEGNTNIASGDDVFLFEKFLQLNKNKVKYLKNKAAIVTTFPVDSWKKLFQQRIRWAAKTSNISLVKTKAIGAIIFLGNLFVIVNCFSSVGFQQKLAVLLLKLSIDLLLILPTLYFFNQQKNWWKLYFFSSLLYPFFSVIVVFQSLFFNYSWKGRTFKK